MKAILLCDDSDVQTVSQKAKSQKCGIEVQSFYRPLFCEDTEQIQNHKKYISEISPLSLHAPYGDLCPGSFDQMVRDVAKNRFNLAYKVSEQLNIDNLVFHIGWVPGAGNIQNWSSRCIDFWNEFIDEKINKKNYYIENLFDLDPEVISQVVSGINRENVKVCLDIGHAHCKSSMDLIQWIKTFASSIGYVHIHDNNGKEDEHLGIGKGNLPMLEVLTALNQHSPDAMWALEVRIEDIDESINWLKKNKFI